MQFAPGYFPSDIIPGGNQDGGGPPITGPTLPPTDADSYNPEAAEGIKEILATNQKVSCIVSAATGAVVVYWKVAPPGKTAAERAVEKAQEEIRSRLDDELDDVIVESGERCLNGEGTTEA
jgi:hypothetical protein